MLGLADAQHTKQGIAQDATVADALAHGVCARYVDDPIEAVVEGVRVELEGLASVIDFTPVSLMLDMLAARLATATKLLRWCDNREKMPLDEPPEEEPNSAPVSAAAAPQPAPETPPEVEVGADEDLEETQDGSEGPPGG